MLNTEFSTSFEYNRFRITECRKSNGREVLLGLVKKEMAEPMMVFENKNNSMQESILH